MASYPRDTELLLYLVIPSPRRDGAVYFSDIQSRRTFYVSVDAGLYEVTQEWLDQMEQNFTKLKNAVESHEQKTGESIADWFQRTGGQIPIEDFIQGIEP